MAYDVVITQSFAQAEAWQKRCAHERAGGVFAQVVMPFDAWIADLWELHGDGRMLVEGAQREMLLEMLADGGLPGVAPVAAQCARRALGVKELQQVLDAVRRGQAVDVPSEGERGLAELLVRYEDEMYTRGLIEAGQAVAALAAKSEQVFPRPLRVLMPDAAPLTWMQSQFFKACPQLAVDMQLADGAGGIDRAPQGIALRFGCPSGRLAQPGLIADAIEELVATGSVVVTCTDPLDMAERLAPRLCESGRSVCAQATKAFSQTDFGRAFLACYHVLHEDVWSPSYLADAVRSFFSGFSQADAVQVDCALRADRLVRRDVVLADLRAASELFSQLEELASDPDADVLVGVFEQRVQAALASSAWQAEQLAALGALHDITAAARMANAGLDACVEALARASVPVACRFVPEGQTLWHAKDEVFVTTQSIAARQPTASCALAVVADLTAEDYPVAEKDDALATFLGAVGLQPEETVLDRARREFSALLALPTESVLLVRPLGDDAADETYPAVVLEEFVDAYRADPAATDDIDNEYRLPAELQADLYERGEELLFANERAANRGMQQRQAGQVEGKRIDYVGPETAAQVLARRFDSEGNPLEGACPSPSQIEVYLECPFRWFAQRRLRVEGLDEGFGPLEKGTFAHSALEEFYRRFQESRHAKVAPDNLDAARELMRAVIDELVAFQFDEEPCSGRLVPASQLERQEVKALCDQLVAFLDYEAQLLPTFHPAYLEFEIDADHAVDYAGYSLVGKVDRIDVDDAGHAVILDYKASVNSEQEIGGKTDDHPGKVQTRIYARAVERALGLQVVGALYVSYGSRPGVAGAYDPRVLDTAHLPGVKPKNCACGLLEEIPDQLSEDYSLADLTFPRMLDQTEAVVSHAIDAMTAGQIPISPSTTGQCDYCPVLSCPKKGA